MLYQLVFKLLAVATSALDVNANGTYNTAFGRSALSGNTNGSQNAAFGWGTLNGVSANYNTAIGSMLLEVMRQ